ncbi:MAG: hypothetical protein ACOCQR_00920 [bacterium]
MKNITVKEFNEKIKEKCKEYILTPYNSEEFNVFGKMIVVSNEVDEISTLKKSKRHKDILALILPDDDFGNYSEELSRYCRVLAPYFTIYNYETEKPISVFRRSEGRV